MEIKDFLKGKVIYDPDSTQIFAVDDKGGLQLILDVRGWGALQNIFELDMVKAAEFQDKMGDWIAEAINEKIERENATATHNKLS